MRSLAPLTTASEEKTALGHDDMVLLTRIVWEHFLGSRTPRMAIQDICITGTLYFFGERIGSYVESGAQRGSNEAAKYRDMAWWIIPNPFLCSSSSLPFVSSRACVAMTRRKRAYPWWLPKTPRIAPLIPSSPFSLSPSRPPGNVFTDVTFVQNIFKPKHSVTQQHCLSIRPEKMHTVVFRDEILSHNGNDWTISPTKAIPALCWCIRCTSLFQRIITMMRLY
ncbi:hypothetical protein OF83DRAFT_424370 [Amylostereum chailletii]|nr:hypothetical protein OF83DRAFT_424370 [Amylostereum chailletii]